MTLGFNLTYTQLLTYFAPRQITNDEEYWATQAVVDELLTKEALSEPEQTYLNLLAVLLEDYDEAQKTVVELRGLPLIRSLIDELGLKQKDLLPIFKFESTVSSVLSGRRQLNLEHVAKLANFFDLPHHLFFDDELLQTTLQTWQPSSTSHYAS